MTQYQFITLIGTMCGCMGTKNPGVQYGRLRSGKTSITCGKCSKQTVLIKMIEVKLPKLMTDNQLKARGRKWLFRQFERTQLRRMLEPEAFQRLEKLLDAT